MSQNVTHRTTEEQSRNWLSGNHNFLTRKDCGKEVAILAETKLLEHSVERLLVVSLAVSLDKIRHRAGSAVTDEFINILHQENFNQAVFMEMIKKSGDCKAINEDVIGRCKNS